MLKLLFYSAVLIPLVSLPWITTKADAVPQASVDLSYEAKITEPNVEALTNCDAADVPVFFHDDLILTHSAEFITESLQAAKACGSVDLTIIPVVPDDAEARDLELSKIRMAELNAYIGAVTERANINARLEQVEKPVTDEVSTLYMNGRAAIIQIDPDVTRLSRVSG